MKNKTLIGALAVLLLFVAPYFALIAYFAYFDKDVVYLRGGETPWMLNPQDSPTVDYFPMDFPSTYQTMITLDSPAAKARIAINAVKAYTLRVNETALSDEESTARDNWKFAREYDIAGYLKPGLNTISVHVRSPYSVTALRTKGDVVTEDGSSVSLNSGESWGVSSEKAFAPMNIVPGVLIPVNIPVHESLMDKVRAGMYWAGSFYLFSAAILLVAALFLVPGALRKLDGAVSGLVPGSLKTEKGRRTLEKVFALAVFVVLAVVLFNNFMKYPAERTGDYQFHVEYLRHFLASWRVPLAPEGFQMYNPPLFYLLSAVLYKVFGGMDVVRYAQLVNSVATFFTVWLVYLIVRRVVGETASALAALTITAFLPVLLYKAPSVSGESLFTFFATSVFYLWIRYLEKPDGRMALAAGLVMGVGFMTRYTALFPLLGVLAGFAYLIGADNRIRKSRLLDLGIFSAALFAVCGWYYIRNFMHFHTFFPISGSPNLFFYRQVPGYRDWDFYTNITALFVNNPISKNNVLESLFAGCYATFWYDGQRLFTVTQSFQRVFVALALAVLPSVLMVWGAIRAGAEAVSGGRDARTVFLGSCLVTASLGLSAFVLGSHRWPTYAWQKSFYFMFLLVPFICFLGLGLKALAARSGWLAIIIWTAALCLVNLTIFYL